ncbi:MAG: right-handed parallel beta-helix repeat-containing protein [Nitrospira sp.]
MQLTFYGMCALLVLFCAAKAESSSYYVATTGNDSNPGTKGSPFFTIQKCVDVVIAGDTCLVGDGTYTDTDGNGIVVYIRKSHADGTAVNPITIKSVNPFMARIELPGVDAQNAGFRIGRSYYIIEGFEITGGAGGGKNASTAGVVFTSGSSGSIVRNNIIHHIGSTICSSSVFGISGVFADDNPSNITITNNRIYSVGRLRIGENGCSLAATPLQQNDHGIYIKNVNGLTISRNLFYDTNRGFAIALGTGTMSNVSVYHNTWVGGSPTGTPSGQIILSGVLTNVSIKNNISYGAVGGMVNFYTVVASNVTISSNLSDMPEKLRSYIGVTFSNNIAGSASLGFVDPSKNDFRLTRESPAINRGTTIGVPPVKDGAPDIGCYEFSEQDSSVPSIPIGLAIK